MESMEVLPVPYKRLSFNTIHKKLYTLKYERFFLFICALTLGFFVILIFGTFRSIVDKLIDLRAL